MSWTDSTLADFGRQLGIEGLEFGPGNFVQFDWREGGVLGIRRGETDIAIYLARQLDYDKAPVLRRALQLCDYRNGWPLAVQTGLRGDAELLFLARLPERQFTLQALEQALDLLGRLHEQARGR